MQTNRRYGVGLVSKHLGLGVALILAALAAAAQNQARDGDQWTPAVRRPHETRWELLERESTPFGREATRVRSYVEWATGLNFFNETTQQWEPSREEWQVYSGGIVAQAGRHKVILVTAAAQRSLGGCVDVDVLTADGVRLICSPSSLGFYDPVDGKQVIVAVVKPDCAPEWGAAPNEIMFRDCFDRVRGSIRFIYNLAGVRQHIVLEQKLELPEGFSDKSRLECYTVFAPGTPAPGIQTRVLRSETNPVLRAQMVEPDFTDSELSFGGEMKMRAGKAFSLGDEVPGRAIRVGKQFVEMGGLPVLIEAVEFKQLEPLLARLASVERTGTGLLAVNSTRQLRRVARASEKAVERSARRWESRRQAVRAAGRLKAEL